MDSLIRRASELHPASGVARTLLKLLRNDDFNLKKVIGCLEKDPALVARVLATVNSVRYGAVRQISNLQQAIALLGRRKLRTIVLTFSVIERLTKGVHASVFSDYWKRSLTTSIVANALAHESKVDANDAYTAGLLTDIGVLVLAQFESADYLPVFEQNSHGPELIRAEVDMFGYDHAHLGARLLDVWQFPKDVVTPVSAHHCDDEAESETVTHLVKAGNLMPGATWIADGQSLHAAYDYFEKHFEFNIDSFISFATEVNDLVDEEARAYCIEGVEKVNCESLRTEARGLLRLAQCEN